MEILKTDDIIEKRFYYEAERELKKAYPELILWNPSRDNDGYSTPRGLAIITQPKKFMRYAQYKPICRFEREFVSDMADEKRPWRVECYLEKYNDIIKRLAETFKLCKVDYYKEDFNGFE